MVPETNVMALALFSPKKCGMGILTQITAIGEKNDHDIGLQENPRFLQQVLAGFGLFCIRNKLCSVNVC
jgi:hypothetical protein